MAIVNFLDERKPKDQNEEEEVFLLREECNTTNWNVRKSANPDKDGMYNFFVSKSKLEEERWTIIETPNYLILLTHTDRVYIEAREAEKIRFTATASSNKGVTFRRNESNEFFLRIIYYSFLHRKRA